MIENARSLDESVGFGLATAPFSDTDDEAWGHRNSVIAKGDDGRMTVYSAPLPEMGEELRTLLAGDHR